ncbi:MAG: hypothetical protein IT330_14860 [Anaerolineae bacterium]|nr:hypothetical protein [Anaerolineae bacterium]
MQTISPEHLHILRTIHARLENSGLNWVVTGSLGFALQGILVEVRDIDIQTDKAGAYRIEELFSECVTRRVAFSAAEKICSYFGALMIDGIKVEIMGDIQKRLEDGAWEDPVDWESHKRFVEFAEMKVPVLSLAYEYQAYLKLGRLEKAEMLRKWLSSRPCLGGV